MKTSCTIAGLAGPMLIALTISELLNPRFFDANIAPVTPNAASSDGAK